MEYLLCEIRIGNKNYVSLRSFYQINFGNFDIKVGIIVTE